MEELLAVLREIRDELREMNQSKRKPSTSSVKFEPPSLQEVNAYCRSRGNSVDAELFMDFYIGKNWMVGKNKMKDWKATVRTWEKQQRASDGNGSNGQKDLVIANNMSAAELEAWKEGR